MSALGHKQRFRSVIAMSALPPKADMRQISSNKSSLFVCRIGLFCSHLNKA